MLLNGLDSLLFRDDEFVGDARPLVELWPGNRSLSSSRTHTGEKMSPEKAMGMSAVWTCVDIISSSGASLPLPLNKRTGKGKGQREVFDSHPVHRVCTLEPNRRQTPYEFFRLLFLQLCLNGNAYIEILLNGRFDVNELFLLTPDRVQPKGTASGDIEYWYHAPGKAPVKLDSDRIIHVRGQTMDGVVGMSPIRQMREAVNLGLTLEKFQAEFMANDATPRGILKTEGVLESPENKKRIREEWMKIQGGRNRNRIAILDAKFDYKQIGLSLEDAQFVESREFQLEEVCRWFRVPQHKVGLLKRSTNNNIEHQGKEFETDCMDPHLTNVEQAMSFGCLTQAERRSGLFLEFDRDELDRADSNAREERAAKRILTGQWSFNEARASRNEAPFEGGDLRIQPASHVPVGTVPDKAGTDTTGDTKEEDNKDAQEQDQEEKKNSVRDEQTTRDLRTLEPILRDALTRIYTREGKALAHKYKQLARRGSGEQWLAFTRDFISDLRDQLKRSLNPLAEVISIMDICDGDKMLRDLIEYSISVSELEVKNALDASKFDQTLARFESWSQERTDEVIHIFVEE